LLRQVASVEGYSGAHSSAVGSGEHDLHCNSHPAVFLLLQDSPAAAMAIAGVCGGVFAASASHPFDTIKTRMQV